MYTPYARQYNILVVDDSATTRAVIKRVIHLTGLPIRDIHEAADGSSALATLELLGAENPVDLIFTDLNMPGMGGAEFTRQLRTIDRYKSTPVLVISAQPDAACLHGLEPDAVQGWLSKPFTPEGVRDLIHRVVGIPEPQGDAV